MSHLYGAGSHFGGVVSQNELFFELVSELRKVPWAKTEETATSVVRETIHRNILKIPFKASCLWDQVDAEDVPKPNVLAKTSTNTVDFGCI